MTAVLIALGVVATLAVMAAVSGWIVAVHQARRIQFMRRRLAGLVLSEPPAHRSSDN